MVQALHVTLACSSRVSVGKAVATTVPSMALRVSATEVPAKMTHRFFAPRCCGDWKSRGAISSSATGAKAKQLPDAMLDYDVVVRSGVKT